MVDSDKNCKSPMLNKIKNRLLILSPTVKAGLEKECSKSDFFREGEKAVGKGGFGEVWKVIHKATNKLYVIKVIDKKNIIEQKMVDQMNREIEIMYRVNHPHVMKLVNHFEDDDKFYLVMYYASKGQLYSLLKKQSRFDQRTAAQYMRELIEAVKYLHSFDPPIIHRDIKPENLLLDENFRMKLTDFGWSNFKNEEIIRTTYCGTPEYLAPEMVKKQGHDTSVDIWSLGVLLFELLSGYAPFSGSNQDELFSNIKKLKINWPNDFPPLAKNLISKILKLNPKERISLDEILSHSWFEKNPIVKPLLNNVITDPKELLESHLIQIKTESMSDQINEIVNKKKESITKSRQISHENSIESNSQIVIYTLKSDNEKFMKENYELKFKLDKIENEFKNQKIESSKLRDQIASQISQQEIQKFKEEIEKYKILNKERIDMLSEYEEKNNEICEYKNKIRNYENEMENLNRTIAQLNEKNFEFLKIIENNDQNFSDLKNKINTLNKEKEEISNNYQRKLEILQIKVLDNTEEDSGAQLAKVVEILNDSINDFKSIFKTKISNLSELCSELKMDLTRVDNIFTNLIKERSNAVYDLLNKSSRNIEDEVQRIRQKIIKENQNKNNDIVDWLKKQIQELQAFKNKSNSQDIRISQLETHIKNINSQIELANTKVYNLEKVIELKESKITEMKSYSENVEAKLSDVKDFVFKNCSDQLDIFNNTFKNYYN